MSFEVVTRPAVEADLPYMTILTEALWLEHAEHAQDLQHAGRIRAYDYGSHVADSFNRESDQWFVATDGDVVVGSVRTELETGRNPLYKHDKVLYIDDIAVAAEHRRRGVGKVLLTACERYAAENGIGLLQAMIYDWNVPSTALFEGEGFVSRRGDFFRVLA